MDEDEGNSYQSQWQYPRPKSCQKLLNMSEHSSEESEDELEYIQTVPDWQILLQLLY